MYCFLVVSCVCKVSLIWNIWHFIFNYVILKEYIPTETNKQHGKYRIKNCHTCTHMPPHVHTYTHMHRGAIPAYFPGLTSSLLDFDIHSSWHFSCAFQLAHKWIHNDLVIFTQLYYSVHILPHNLLFLNILHIFQCQAHEPIFLNDCTVFHRRVCRRIICLLPNISSGSLWWAYLLMNIHISIFVH